MICDASNLSQILVQILWLFCLFSHLSFSAGYGFSCARGGEVRQFYFWRCLEASARWPSPRVSSLWIGWVLYFWSFSCWRLFFRIYWLYWCFLRLSRIVPLKEPHRLSHRLKLRCGCCALDKDLELQIRFAEAAVGGTLNSHFPDLTSCQWLAWALPHEQLNQLVRNTAYYRTSLAVAHRLNISPTRG